MINNYLADAIDDVADYMEEHGSVSGRLMDEDGRVCMIGAICQVAAQKYRLPGVGFHTMVDVVGMFLAREYNAPVGGVHTYSDTHTHQERLDAFRKCAKSLRS